MTSPIVVFVLLGANPAPTLVHSARVAKMRLPNAHIMLITDRPHDHRTFPGELIEYRSNRAPEPLAVIRRRFPERKQLAGGYWIFTLERLFALAQIAHSTPDSPVIHIESDVLLSMTERHLETLSNRCQRTAVPRYSPDMGIASLLYSPSVSRLRMDLHTLAETLHQRVAGGKEFITDMQLLGGALDTGTLQELPTRPEDAWPLTDSCISRKIVFDGLAYGQYLFGQDPLHNSGIRVSGHQNEFFPHDLSQCRWSLQQEPNGQCMVGYDWDGCRIDIANIHMHSKEIVDAPQIDSNRWRQALDEANGLQERQRSGPFRDLIHSQKISFVNKIRISRRSGRVRSILDCVRRLSSIVYKTRS